MTSRLVASILVLTLTGCPTPPEDPTAIQFWSLVKITADDSSFAFKCLHQQNEEKIDVACFSPVEMPLFTVSIDGNAVLTVASSPVVEEKIPFELSRIGLDVWRAHVAMTDADLAEYVAVNEAHLIEKKLIVDVDDSGVVVAKTFYVGDETVAAIDYVDHDENGRAGRIELESLEPSYVIEIVQGD